MHGNYAYYLISEVPMDKIKPVFSKKLCVTILVLILGVLAPLIYKNNGIDDSVTLAVLAIITGVSVSYGIVQGRIDLNQKKAPKDEAR